LTAVRGQTLYFRVTVGVGFGVLLLAAVESAAAAIAVLAVGAAAVVATEVIQVPGDERSLDPVDSQPFSFASPAHLALVIALGTWPAALLAAVGVVVVDFLRGASRRAIAFNASVFAIATAGGGAAFALAGGEPGKLALPEHFPGYLALSLVYVLLNLTLVNAMDALGTGRAPLAELKNVLRTDSSSRFAEVGLGLIIGLSVLYEPWALVACVPLVVAVYRAYERLALLRRETAHALETFANVVDERDPHTYSHSTRVAEEVEQLGQALGLPSAQVARLRWAGRLHDLGKITVDSSVLNKPGALSEPEFEAMRRHARLSARLLRKFRLAAAEARAVEYHHERYDGKGYYGIDGEDVPLAAYFLAVADSYDAMTSDRAYRAGMPEEEALAEIERCAGTHFHPSVARAFVALKRGGDPRTHLSRAELRGLRAVPTRREPPSWATGLSAATLVTLLGTVVALLALGIGAVVLSAAGGATALAGLLWRRHDAHCAQRFAATVRRAVDGAPQPFNNLVRALSQLESLEWVGLVRWDVDTLSGHVALERMGLASTRPTADALTSWLLREAEGGGLLVAAGAEVGMTTTLVALPLFETATPAGAWLVLSFRHDRPGWLDRGLLDVRAELAAAFEVTVEPPARLQPVAAVS
jgi:putative nucleotidyltransferase with HDIG domain